MIGCNKIEKSEMDKKNIKILLMKNKLRPIRKMKFIETIYCG